MSEEPKGKLIKSYIIKLEFEFFANFCEVSKVETKCGVQDDLDCLRRYQEILKRCEPLIVAELVNTCFVDLENIATRAEVLKTTPIFEALVKSMNSLDQHYFETRDPKDDPGSILWAHDAFDNKLVGLYAYITESGAPSDDDWSLVISKSEAELN